MDSRFERTGRIIGEKGIEKLRAAKVLLFGLGGVGGHAAEALARAGVGCITIVDGDIVDRSNLNRQIIATEKTIGMEKTKAMKARLEEIMSDIKVEAVQKVYSEETKEEFEFKGYDYIIDAIDDVKAKVDIIKRAKEARVPVISSMGTGNKLKPQLLEVEDIHNTSICPLAKAVRKELKKLGIYDVKVVYSKETPVVKAIPPGSTSFVPGAAGLIIAGEVVRHLIYKTIY